LAWKNKRKEIGMETALALVGGNVRQLNLEPEISQLKQEIRLMEAKGLKGQVKKLKVRLLSTALEKVGMCLLEVDNWRVTRRVIGRGTGFGVRRVLPSGERRGLDRYHTHCDLTPLSKYEGNIPPSIMENIPPTLSDKRGVVVIEAGKDPFIAIRITRFSKYYIGLFSWE